MASPFHLHVTAAQVGTYFVGQYYQVLQQQPELIHQFYSEGSTVIRIDGSIGQTASGMLQIHKLVMSLNYIGIEIKTAHSLDSWNGGVLIMVSGSVHIKDVHNRKKFMQTFFLAPQEKGYFILNDIFHFVEEEMIYQHLPVAYLPQSNLDSEINASTLIQEPVSNYILSKDIQARDFVVPKNEENGHNDDYSFPEQRVQKVPESEQILEDNFQVVHSNGSSLQSSTNRPVQEHLSAPVEEPAAEPQKHTYASILQVAKVQYVPTISQSNVNKTSKTSTPPSASVRNHVADATSQQVNSPSVTAERPSELEGVVEDSSPVEDEVEFKSVYVRNVPPTASTFEIEEEFKKFGKIKPDGVAIRTRKDIDVCYAFVEFEDTTGVQNAIKASSVEVCGQEVYIEGRRPNRNSTIRGGRGRERGRMSYQTDGGARGRLGSRYFRNSRPNGTDGGEHEYSYRPKGINQNNRNNNGFYRQTSRQQERKFSGNSHPSLRNGHTPSSD